MDNEQIIRQRYKVLEQLAEDDLTITYLTEDLSIPVTTKPKCIVTKFKTICLDPLLVHIFDQEVQRLKEISNNHPHLPTFFLSFSEKNHLYLVEELKEGKCLSSGNKELKDETEILHFLSEMLEILAYLHENKVIHLAVCPNNILIQDKEDLVLLNFGNLKEISTLTISSSIPNEDIFLGPIGYIPKEQLLGEVQYASDLYALAITTIELFTGLTPEKLSKDEQGKVLWRNHLNLSQPLALIFDKMLEPDYPQRYQNANEALQAIGYLITKQVPVISSSTINQLAPDLDLLYPEIVGDKWGYKNSQGKLIISPEFDWADGFSEDLAAVKINNKWGYIDRTGIIVIDLYFDWACSFVEGSARVKIQDKWVYIDKKGKIIFDLEFDFARDFEQEIGAVCIDEKWGYIDSNGKMIIPPKFDDIREFSQGIGVVCIDNKWGYIDSNGKMIVTPQFDEARKFYQDRAEVCLNNKWGYINRTGTVIIKPQFEQVKHFCEGIAAVYIRNKWGYIDLNGNILIEPKFEEAHCFSEGLAKVKLDRKYGYINQQGKIVIIPDFVQAEDFVNGKTIVIKETTEGRQSYIIQKKDISI